MTDVAKVNGREGGDRDNRRCHGERKRGRR